MEEGSADDLLTFLRRLQEECGGTIPFERYMREALYHPDFGYYAAHVGGVGEKGDFSTSSTLSGELGRAIAAWVIRRADDAGWQRIPIIEIGAGNGSLARSVLRHLDWGTAWHTDYMIHETSPVLREQQRKLLRWRRVRWVKSMKEALRNASGNALIFSNELVDAFPCRLFELRGSQWEELGVKISAEGSLTESPLGALPSDPWFETLGKLPQGQRVERHDSFQKWMQEWSPEWYHGSMLTIDYGNRGRLLHSGRAGGSLRAYWRHQCFKGRDLYARFGKQDITADVNFSDLIEWGRDIGWNTISLGTQREFLDDWIPVGARREDSPFSIVGGAGDFFRVLEQSPGY